MGIIQELQITKYFKYFVMAVLAISLAACGGSGKLTPTSKKVNGPLGKFFEVVERDYKMSENELSVEFKRIAEGGPNDASWSSEPTFTVELQDEDGNSIASEHTDVVFSKEQLESVFSLGVDETASITFRFGKDKAKDAVKFKVSSKWDGAEENDIEASNVGLNLADGNYVYEGLWKSQKYKTEPCRISFEKRGDNIYGSKYTNLKFNVSIPLKGIIDGDSLFFEGGKSGNELIIHLSGDGNQLNGIGNDYTHKDLNVRVVFSKDSSGLDIEEEETEDISLNESSGSEDWDELLSSYEKYVDKYISYVKKAAKGDMTALAEYPSLMEKAQEFSDKLQRAQGDMSASQWARYNKITTKMMKAAQEMQQ